MSRALEPLKSELGSSYAAPLFRILLVAQLPCAHTTKTENRCHTLLFGRSHNHNLERYETRKQNPF